MKGSSKRKDRSEKRTKKLLELLGDIGKKSMNVPKTPTEKGRNGYSTPSERSNYNYGYMESSEINIEGEPWRE